MNWISSNIDRIVDLTIGHIWLTLAPTILGLEHALGWWWWAHRSGRGYAAIVGTTSLLYTIPSLALFILLPVILGTKILDPINIVVALTLYTLALLVRVVADGLSSVPHDTVAPQRQWVIALAAATVGRTARRRTSHRGGIAGCGRVQRQHRDYGCPAWYPAQLGSLFTQGFQLRLYVPLITGIVLCVVLAVVFDGLIIWLNKLATWRQRTVTS